MCLFMSIFQIIFINIKIICAFSFSEYVFSQYIFVHFFFVVYQVKDGKDDYGWGTIINFQKKANQKVCLFIQFTESSVFQTFFFSRSNAISAPNYKVLYTILQRISKFLHETAKKNIFNFIISMCPDLQPSEVTTVSSPLDILYIGALKG